MKKIKTADYNRIWNAAIEFNSTNKAFEKALTAICKALPDVIGQMKDERGNTIASLLERREAARELLHGMAHDAAEEMREYFESRSSDWQESNAGYEYDLWHGNWLDVAEYTDTDGTECQLNICISRDTIECTCVEPSVEEIEIPASEPEY